MWHRQFGTLAHDSVGPRSIDLNHSIDIEYPFLAVRNAGSSLQLIVSRSLAASLAIFSLSCQGTVGTAESSAGDPSGTGGPGSTTGGGPMGGFPASNHASASVARRLSRSELDTTVRDLLGDTTNPASKFLQEDEYTPFDNDYSRQQASAALIDSLEAMADDIAARVRSAANRAASCRARPRGRRRGVLPPGDRNHRASDFSAARCPKRK